MSWTSVSFPIRPREIASWRKYLSNINIYPEDFTGINQVHLIVNFVIIFYDKLYWIKITYATTPTSKSIMLNIMFLFAFFFNIELCKVYNLACILHTSDGSDFFREYYMHSSSMHIFYESRRSIHFYNSYLECTGVMIFREKKNILSSTNIYNIIA